MKFLKPLLGIAAFFAFFFWMLVFLLNHVAVAAPLLNVYQGGTGRTTYTKGDILIGTTSPYRIGILPVGPNAYCLTASSTQSTGLAWSPCATGAGSGLTSLNGLTNSALTIASGTAGTIFNIQQSGSTITLNLPTADATHTGQLNSGDFVTFNAKVATSRSISTTFPIQGGGDLSSNRTLSVATGNLTLGTNLSFTSGDGIQVLLGTSTAISLSATPSFTTVTATNGVTTNATTTNLVITGSCTGCNTLPGSSTPAGLTNSIQYKASPTLFAGSEMFFVSPSFGINSSTPRANLSVQGTSSSPTLTVFAVASSTGAQFLTVTPGGNVGIGTSSPGFKLDVNGAINATSLNVNGTAFNPSSQWTSSGSDVYYNTGNVGVGTATPNSKLSVYGDIRIQSGSGGSLIFPDGSSMTSANLGSAGSVSNSVDAVITGDADANASGNIVFKIGSTEKLRLSNSTINNLFLGVGSTPIFKIGGDSPTLNRDTVIGRGAGPLTDYVTTNTGAFMYTFPPTTVGYWAGHSLVANTSAACAGAGCGTYGDTAIGSFALQTCSACAESTAVGSFALNQATGFGNTGLGMDAARGIITGQGNTAVGNDALPTSAPNSGGAESFVTAIGQQAYRALNFGDNGTAVGQQAGDNIITSGQDTIIGKSALANFVTTSNNTVVGYQAAVGVNNSAVISNNTVIGTAAGAGLNTSGNNNVFLGYHAGDAVSSGANNVVIGYDVDAPSNTASNQVDIANLIFGSGASGTGSTIAGNVGIASNTPIARLAVTGQAGNNTAFIVASSSGAIMLQVSPGATTTVTNLNVTGNCIGCNASENNGTATYAGNTTSGTQTIAHGLGRIPKIVRIFATKTQAASGPLALSQGYFNGVTSSTSYMAFGVSGTGGVSSNMVEIWDSATAHQTATISVDATNITLTWTKTNSPTSDNINLVWDVQ